MDDYFGYRVCASANGFHRRSGFHGDPFGWIRHAVSSCYHPFVRNDATAAEAHAGTLKGHLVRYILDPCVRSTDDLTGWK